MTLIPTDTFFYRRLIRTRGIQTISNRSAQIDLSKYRREYSENVLNRIYRQ